MIAEGTEAKAVEESQIQAVAADVEVFRRAHRLSAKSIAKAVGYGHSTITEFLGGKYAGNRAEVAINLDAWLVDEEARRSRPETTQFVWTNVAQQIEGAAGYCREHRSIGLVYGPLTSGLGKTTALRAIYERMGARACSLVTIDKVDASPTGLLRKILSAMHVAENGSNKNRFDRIVEKLRGRAHLLLIDQIHNLRYSKEDRPFYILTDLHDATATTSQLWCGTSDVVSYLERQKIRNVDESLAQVRRRIFPCVDLIDSLGADGKGGAPLVTVEQVKEMFARNKLKLTANAARFLCQICNTPDSGSVGLCVRLIEYATMLATMPRREASSIDVPLIQEAMRRGFSPRRAELLMHRMEEDAPPAAAKMG